MGLEATGVTWRRKEVKPGFPEFTSGLVSDDTEYEFDVMGRDYTGEQREGKGFFGNS